MNDYFLLNPLVKIIPNKSRNVFYTVDEFFHSPENICPLSPADSIFLLLFDGTRTKKDVRNDYQKIFRGLSNFDVDIQLNKIKEKTGCNELLVDSSKFSKEEIEKLGNRIDPTSLVISKENFDMKNGDLKLDYPLSLNFNVATTCNFSCEYCYHPLNKVSPFISLSRLKEILKQFKDIGSESVMLTGGDPLLRPDIDDILSYLHSINFFYSLSTKSILSQSRIDKLIETAGFDRIQISLDSNRSHIVEKLIHVNEDYFKKCIQQIEYMLNKGIDVRVKSVLTSLNADYVDEYISFLVALGVKHIQIVSYGRSGYRHKDELFATEEQLTKASQSIKEAREKYPQLSLVGGGYSIQKAFVENSVSFFEKRAVCNAGRFGVTMLPNGEVTICEQLPYNKKYIIGDLSKEDLLDWWNGEKLKTWLSPPSRKIFAPGVPCYSCKEEDYTVCHTKYSRCLRYCREYFGSTEMPDVHCPKTSFEEFRIV